MYCTVMRFWVRVPVLSKTIVFAAATASRKRPPLTETLCPLLSRIADSTAIGMESFSAQEKSTISTASVFVTLRVTR